MRSVRLTVFGGLLTAASLAGAQSAEPLSLKGYSLGQEMTRCPTETVSEQAQDGLTLCLLGPTTLANQPADSHGVFFIDGKVAGVMVALATRGRNANSAVLDALVEKFGRPTSSKPNLNEARWQIGQQVLSFDGYAGKVFLADLEANRRRKGNAAQSNKKDL